MPKSINQKRRLLYLMQILLEQTDENHFLNLSQLMGLLAQHGIDAERKSLYDRYGAAAPIWDRCGVCKGEKWRLSRAEPQIPAGGAETAGG